MERELAQARDQAEVRERERASNEADRKERCRQHEMNRQSFEEVVPQLRQAYAALASLAATQPGSLERRLQNRAELRLLVYTQKEVLKLPPGFFLALGMSGLSAPELRAIHHVLLQAKPPGAAAARYRERVYAKTAAMEAFTPAACESGRFEPRHSTTAGLVNHTLADGYCLMGGRLLL